MFASLYVLSSLKRCGQIWRKAIETSANEMNRQGVVTVTHAITATNVQQERCLVSSLRSLAADAD